ncbi:hypothetical protein [Thermocatellispora tengchongensis]|uniref:hypothetical protein n=1 Tax=Thermocatellispora tengchongensis TaxID=1073253 RepID=UPI0036297AB2
MGDQLGGPLLQEQAVGPAQIRQQRARLPGRQQRGDVTGSQERLEQGPLARRALLQEPPLDGLGGLTGQDVHRGMRASVQAGDRHHAARVPGQRVQDRDPGGGERLHAPGQVLEARDVDHPLLQQRSAARGGAERLLGVPHSGQGVGAVQHPRQLRIALIAQQHPGLLVQQHHGHVRVRDGGPEALEHRPGRTDEHAVEVHLDRLGEVQLLRVEPGGPAPPPRPQDRRAYALAHRLTFEEQLENALGGCRVIPPETCHPGRS